MDRHCPVCLANVYCPYHPQPQSSHSIHADILSSDQAGPNGGQFDYAHNSRYPIGVPLSQAPGATAPVYAVPNLAGPVHAPLAVPPQPSRKRSTTRPAKAAGGKKARKANTEASHAGVGPSSRSRVRASSVEVEAAALAAQTLPPTYDINETSTKEKASTNLTKRSDCWIQVIGVQYETEPVFDHAALQDARSRASAQPEANISDIAKRPSELIYARLLCIPCLTRNRLWKTWKNSGSGITAGVLNHLVQCHPQEYHDGRSRLGFLDLRPEQQSDDIAPEEITTEGIARYMAELVAEQDLSFNFSESRALRRLLCYVGQKNIKSEHLPKRKAVASMAAKLSQEAKARIKDEMKHCLGRVSLTSDLWSDEMERPFMAITGHYIDKTHNSVLALLAFRFVEGAHDGKNLGEYFFSVLQDQADYMRNQIGSITLDNAANNDTLMVALQDKMMAEGYSFDDDGNRIRCFPHVINLAVNAFFDGLSRCKSAYLAEKAAKNKPTGSDSMDYLAALDKRPDQLCHDIVVALRNGQRRRALQQTIREGNERQHWKAWRPLRDLAGIPTGENEEIILKLKQLQLLLAVKTRWSSRRNMIARFIYLYPAISEYLSKNSEYLGQYSMSHLQFKVLQDIKIVLDIFHLAQELLSAEQTPCLSLAFPVYDRLILMLKKAALRFPALAAAIEDAITKLEAYVAKARSSPIHILAMFLNPCVKYTWIDEHWSKAEQEHAREVVKCHMHMYLEAKEADAEARVSRYNLETSASQAQHRGLNYLLDWEDSLEYSFGNQPSFGTVTPTASPTVLRTSSSYPSLVSPGSTFGSTPSKIASQRAVVVDAEHKKYLAQGISDFGNLGQIDLVKHWTIQDLSFPLLFPMAMDVLPAQASSVSSERVFSSSKLTCTRARNKISAPTVEALQILKYSLRHRPAFTQDTEESELDLLDPNQTLDLMRRLDDCDWDDDAILDDDPLLAYEVSSELAAIEVEVNSFDLVANTTVNRVEIYPFKLALWKVPAGSAVWIITGCATGLGREFVLALLDQGQRVIATARNTERIRDLNEAGAAVLELDVTSSPERLKEIAVKAINIYGRVDYLINNAGYPCQGAIEELSHQETFKLFNTNVFGVLNTTRAFLPHFRERRSGGIVMISSMASMHYFPGLSVYCASKAAISTIAEGLHAEVSGLGIDVLAIDLATFRTPALKRDTNLKRATQVIPDYVSVNSFFDNWREQLISNEVNDPKLGALRIIELISRTGMAANKELPSRLPLGSDAKGPIIKKCQDTINKLEEWSDVICSTGY